eukprot:360043-Chlamydomonas_euryale.AAC.4
MGQCFDFALNSPKDASPAAPPRRCKLMCECRQVAVGYAHSHRSAELPASAPCNPGCCWSRKGNDCSPVLTTAIRAGLNSRRSSNHIPLTFM